MLRLIAAVAEVQDAVGLLEFREERTPFAALALPAMGD